MTSTAEWLLERWPAMRAFLAVAGIAVVAGGIVAAVARPTGFDDGSWLAAYLVLVVGVAQAVLGVGQAYLASEAPRADTVRTQFLTWNVGAAAVVVGTLLAAPVVTSIGGAVTAAALVLFLLGVREAADVPPLATLLYRGLVAVVLVSVPIGLLLAWVRN